MLTSLRLWLARVIAPRGHQVVTDEMHDAAVCWYARRQPATARSPGDLWQWEAATAFPESIDITNGQTVDEYMREIRGDD